MEWIRNTYLFLLFYDIICYMMEDVRMKKALFIIDIQRPFMNMYTKKLPLAIMDYLEHNYFDYVVVTKFVNKIDSPFMKRLGMSYCLEPDTGILDITIHNDYELMEHSSYTVHTDLMDEFLKEKKIKYIYLCGVSTEGSVLKTAMDLFEHNYSIYVLKDLSASVVGYKQHEMAIQLLETTIGKDFVI